jgi:hypothetical protein
MNKKKEPYNIAKTALIIVTCLALIAVFSFIAFSGAIEKCMHKELFTLTYQFLTFVVLGGGLSVLYSVYEKKREDKLKDKEKKELAEKEVRVLQKKFYNDFVQTYKETKKVRRLLRARARKSVDAGIMIKTSEYDFLMKELTVIQLKCEFLKDEVKCNPELFGMIDNPVKVDATQTATVSEYLASPLYQHLKIVENYLNKLVSEYEKRFVDFPGEYYLSEVEFLNLDSMEKLKDFIVKFDDSEAYQEFQKSVDAVLTLLLRKLAVASASQG